MQLDLNIGMPDANRVQQWLGLYSAQIREVRAKLAPGDATVASAAELAVQKTCPEWQQRFLTKDRGLVAWALQRTSFVPA